MTRRLNIQLKTVQLKEKSLRFPVPDYNSVLVKPDIELLLVFPFQYTDVLNRDSDRIAGSA